MDVRANQDNLIDVFERMENFFQRLEIHMRVSSAPEMIDIIVKIMVEVLSILGIAMKEMKQGRLSMWSCTSGCCWLRNLSEKYLKKLIGKTEIEDALKRLDNLTNEEVRMAVAVGNDGAQLSSVSYRENI
jgi:hypothetical protein